MKIIDLIPQVKKTALDMVSWKDSIGNIHEYCRNSNATQNFFKKKGYYYSLDIHSKDRVWLNNNVDKDCVVAYLEDRFVKVMIVKKKGDKFVGLSYLKPYQLGFGGYSVFEFNTMAIEKTIILLEENQDILKIVNQEDWDMCKKKLILNKLEKEDEE